MKDLWTEICSFTDPKELRVQIEESELWKIAPAKRNELLQNSKSGDGGLVDQLKRNIVWYCLQNREFSLKSSEGQFGGIENDVLFETLNETIRLYDPERDHSFI